MFNIKVRTLIAAVIGGTVLTGCAMPIDGTAAAAPVTEVTIIGLLELTGGTDSFTSDGTTCAGDGGYSDLTGGATVTVTTGNGDTVTIGSLDSGIVIGKSCNFFYVIDNLPADKAPFFAEVSHRGRMEAEKTGLTTYEIAGQIGG